MVRKVIGESKCVGGEGKGQVKGEGIDREKGARGGERERGISGGEIREK